MNRLSKSFLAASLVMTAVGLFVSFSGMALSPVWTVVLPYGAIFFGLFLISFVFQKEFADFNPGKPKELPSPQSRKGPSSEHDLPAEGALRPHQPAYG